MTDDRSAAVLADLLIERAAVDALRAAADRLEALHDDQPMTATDAIAWIRGIADRADSGCADAEDILHGIG